MAKGKPVDSLPTRRLRLWEAMLAVFPVIIGNDLKQAPEGCAQLAREQAEALIREWERATQPES